jgi:type II secretory pathway predicted ATPase ExeA/septal ring-binding cell division protein DamX
MYYAHFGLSQAPFRITPNTEFFFSGGNRGPILEALIYAVTHGEGIVKVTGEVGSGKTMLCHMLQARLPAHIESVYIANPSVSPEEILRAIAFELQLAAARDASRLEVLQLLHEFLLKRYAAGKRVVVFVEESQSMPLATLEEIRLLSNLETGNDKLLQIVLFGQPELDDNLRQPNIRQLRERITHSFRLEPLDPAAIREYLMFRMRAAGYRGPDLFSASVVKAIAAASRGLSRRVNLIADKALLAAFSENTHAVRSRHVNAAVRDSEFSRDAPGRAKGGYWRTAGLVAAGAALGIGTYSLLQRTTQEVGTHFTPRASAPVTPSNQSTKVEAIPLTQPVPDARAAAPQPQSASAPNAPAPGQSEVVSPTTATPSAPGPASEPPVAATPEAEHVAPLAAPKESPQERPASRSRAGDLLEARLAATEKWLAAEPPGTLTIQILGSANPEQLKRHLKVISKSVEMNKIFVYRTMAMEKPSLTVLYGSFDDHRAAREALRTLPGALKSYRPLLRTVKGIQGEIQRHQTAQQGEIPSS